SSGDVTLARRSSAIADLHIGIDHIRNVRGARPRVDVRERAIIPRLPLRFCHATVRIVDVTEDDRFGRTSLLACRYYFTVPNRALRVRIRLLQVNFFDFSLNSRSIDALDTERALFHHAAAAHRDIRISQRFKTRRLVIGEQQEVESPYFVRTVVQAITCPDAAVVNHHVDAFGRVRRGADRAYRFARCILAVLAQHRLEEGARIMEIAGEVCVDAQPLHVATDLDLLLTHYGTIVLRLTCNHAG